MNTVSSSSELNHLFVADSLQLILLEGLEEQKALQLPFHLRNLTVLSPHLARIFGINSRRSWQLASFILSIF